jgi:hypothetical protein
LSHIAAPVAVHQTVAAPAKTALFAGAPKTVGTL